MMLEVHRTDKASAIVCLSTVSVTTVPRVEAQLIETVTLPSEGFTSSSITLGLYVIVQPRVFCLAEIEEGLTMAVNGHAGYPTIGVSETLKVLSLILLSVWVVDDS